MYVNIPNLFLVSDYAPGNPQKFKRYNLSLRNTFILINLISSTMVKMLCRFQRYSNYIDLVSLTKISYPLLLVACCPIEGLLQQSPIPVSSILSFHENEPQFWFETCILLLFPSWFASSGSWINTKVCCWSSSKYVPKTGSCFSNSWWLHLFSICLKK